MSTKAQTIQSNVVPPISISFFENLFKKHGGRLLQIRKSFLNLLSAMTATKECQNKLAKPEIMVRTLHIEIRPKYQNAL